MRWDAVLKTVTGCIAMEPLEAEVAPRPNQVCVIKLQLEKNARFCFTSSVSRKRHI